ncbi:MAG: VirB4 family type IV secretion/conjugal transfer ATPase [Alphaproteobacteria bacterium]|nr:VirB4 family type IV secretion/conjugal transfer ATPase [Alphaproteobacteria bacterium]
MFHILKTNALPTQHVEEKELSGAEFIPYLCHWNQETILTKRNELVKVIKIDGLPFQTMDDENVDICKNVRNLLFKSMASGEFALYFHVIRRRQNVFDTSEPEYEVPSFFANQLAKVWHQKHMREQCFVNDIYVTVIRKPDTAGVAYFEHLLKKLEYQTDKGAWERGMRELEEDLQEATMQLLNTLRDYGPEVLGVKETPDGPTCDILKFLSALVNCGETSEKLVPNMDLSHYLPTHRLYFGHKAIEVKGPTMSRFAGIVSVKEYPPHTHAGMLDGFLQMPFELIVSQSFVFTNRQNAINKMRLQQNRMIQAGDKAISQIAEITSALDMAMSGEIGFGDHHLTVLALEDSTRKLDQAMSMVTVEVTNMGAIGVREEVNMEACFWGQLPGNYDYLARKAVVNTMNLAGFSSMHNFPSGKAKGNHWGDAVTVFDTTSGTPYYFNFHVRDVGHTTIIGPTGSGKTVLMNFLCTQALKYKPRMFFFDKDRGAEIFLRAIEGSYNILDPGRPCGFNPLQLPDTSENRTFLQEWLQALVSAHGEVVTAHEVEILNSAINGNYKLEFKDRRLRNIAPFLGVETPGSLAGRLAIWHNKGSHAHIFDNEKDMVDFGKAAVYGFEMGHVLKDKLALSPILLYLFHRISLSLDGTPTMIVLDEAWALIDNPVFAPKIKDWLKVMRKLNAMVVFATQSVEDASKSSISDTLVQQTATQIFLPNLKATQEYKKSFMLSDREFVIVKNTDPGSRCFLIKQGMSSVVARLNLGGMVNAINVLSGRADTVIMLDEIRAEVGDHPNKWLSLFLQRVKQNEQSK